MSKLLIARNVLVKWVVVLCLGATVGLMMGWRLWVKNKRVTITEVAAPEKRNSDDSLRLEKTPTETPKPKQEIPKDAKVQRTISAVVRPHGASGAGTSLTSGSSATGLPPLPSSGSSDVRIDTTIYETKDGQTHAVVSSPDGTVIGGEDNPVVKRIKLAEFKNAFGLVAGVSTAPSKSIGLFYDRDLAWARVGVEVTQTRYLNTGQKDYEVRVKLGIRY